LKTKYLIVGASMLILALGVANASAVVEQLPTNCTADWQTKQLCYIENDLINIKLYVQQMVINQQSTNTKLDQIHNDMCKLITIDSKGAQHC